MTDPEKTDLNWQARLTPLKNWASDHADWILAFVLGFIAGAVLL